MQTQRNAVQLNQFTAMEANATTKAPPAVYNEVKSKTDDIPSVNVPKNEPNR